MESLARHDLHPTFFNCFRQYEMCVGGELDEQGRQRYNTPDLKGKLHTYSVTGACPLSLHQNENQNENQNHG